MPQINLQKCRDHLQNFAFTDLFVSELGWSNPQRGESEVRGFRYAEVAELGGVSVLQMEAPDGEIPDEKTRRKIHTAVTRLHHEHLLIFVDGRKRRSLWSWIKREDGKLRLRTHPYHKGQPGDLFISKLRHIVFGLEDFEAAETPHVTKITGRLSNAFDVERVTKRFYKDFQDKRESFTERIEGIADEHDRKWFASMLLNRLMFIWFLQKKSFVNSGDHNYLQTKLEMSQQRGPNRYYAEFLQALFFEGFAKPAEKRSAKARRLIGNIRYLNGGLFIPHPIEQRYASKIRIPDSAFGSIFGLFQRYSWHLDDTPGGNDNEINPGVLGHIFEKFINDKAFGAYYTRNEITDYLCEQTIHRLILERVNTEREAIPEISDTGQPQFQSYAQMLSRLDLKLCRLLLRGRDAILPNLKILDPACGSGAFLVAAMNALRGAYSAVIGHIETAGDAADRRWLREFRKKHPNTGYGIKKLIITNNLFGVDLIEEAGEICKLRLFLALVASANTEDELEPLPNIDFNILAGNALIGLLRVEDEEFSAKQPDMLRKTYRQAVEEHERKVQKYRETTTYAEDLRALRDDIDQSRGATGAVLDEILLGQFAAHGIRFEQAAWDEAKGKPGKPQKRPLCVEDISKLHPFHWNFEFNSVLQSGGFDIILTNPPWETLKPNGKEFFERHSDIITRKKMTIKEFEKQRRALMQDTRIRKAWLDYQSDFPHQSRWFRAAEQYQRQFGATAGGRRVGSDINLYKLFLEQCHNLLCEGGQCGIVIPGGIYTDLGAKGLREMLFTEAQIGGLFGFENRKEIFEGVHRSFKFVVLTFRKGGDTQNFPTAFMRREVNELAHFPERGAVQMPVNLIRKLSPESFSLMEFQSETDKEITEKMIRFPLLGEQIEDAWNIHFHREIDMTNDSYLFRTEDAPGRLPLYEGKMIWQFDHQFAPDKLKYWIDENEGRADLMGRTEDTGQQLDYQDYRLGFRDVAANTNERTAIMAMLPPNVFCNHKTPNAYITNAAGKRDHLAELFLCALMNSFVVDYTVRMRITTNLTFFYLNQLPIPRLTKKHPAFPSIVKRAALLTCTTPEFDPLARQAGLKNHHDAATHPTTRAQLRAQLDAQIAHLYHLTEPDFRHILSTFPLVDTPTKTATQNAYRDAQRGLIK